MVEINNNPFSALIKNVQEVSQESWRWGTVTSVDPLLVRLDGDSEPFSSSPDSIVCVAVGDRVRVHIYNRRATVMGVSGGGALNAYPIGAYYLSADPTSPEKLFGGRWVRIEGRFIFGADSRHPAGSTGGEETHRLSEAEMPAHRHWLGGRKYAAQAFMWGSSGNVNILNAVAVGGSGSGNRLFTWQNDDNWMGGASVGGNQAHNNMPPYISAYCWRRVG